MLKNRKTQALLTLTLMMCIILAACGGSVASASDSLQPLEASAPEEGDAPAETAAQDLPQSIGLPGIVNARELGGYETTDGTTVKHNILLRTAKLSTASDEELATLKDVFKLRDIVDFREESDTVAEPDPEIEGATYHLIPILPVIEKTEAETPESEEEATEDVGEYTADREFTDKLLIFVRNHGYDVKEYFSTVYDDMAVAENSLEGLRQFFDILLEDEEGAVLWHCSAGKDRTGMAAALVLSALGVDRVAIIEDFLLTNDYRADTTVAAVEAAAKETDDPFLLDQVRLVNDVDLTYVEVFFNSIESHYGSMDNFLEEQMGLTAEKIDILKTKYTE